MFSVIVNNGDNVREYWSPTQITLSSQHETLQVEGRQLA